jgi:hypothetical protein
MVVVYVGDACGVDCGEVGFELDEGCWWSKDLVGELRVDGVGVVLELLSLSYVVLVDIEREGSVGSPRPAVVGTGGAKGKGEASD